MQLLDIKIVGKLTDRVKNQKKWILVYLLPGYFGYSIQLTARKQGKTGYFVLKSDIKYPVVNDVLILCYGIYCHYHDTL